MRSIKFNIEPEIIDWVYSLAADAFLPPEDLKTIEKWKEGKTPTLSEIEKVSAKTHIPFGYFFLSVPPKEDVSFLKFRASGNRSSRAASRELLETMTDMKQIVEWVRNSKIEEEMSKCSVVESLKKSSDVDEAVKSIRSLLGIEKDWFRECPNSFNFIRTAISSLGIIVMMNGVIKNNTHRPLDPDEFRAFAITDDYSPLIFINSCDSSNGRLFSLLHEFVHICLGSDSILDGYDVFSDPVEIFCNAVAAEILVPGDMFRSKWGEFADKSSTERETIKKAAAFFKCSSVVIARRALDFRKIKKDLYDEVANEASSIFKGKDRKGGNFYLTMTTRLDKGFFLLLSSRVAEGKTLYSEAFRLTNTNRITFEKVREYFEDGK